MQTAHAKASRPSALLGKLLGSATLARLVEEVRNQDMDVARSYDRTHNRHNR